jgi:transposase
MNVRTEMGREVIRIQLPPAEVERLESVFRSTDDRPFRDRLQIVLLAHKGRPRQDIALDLCINRRSVQRWLNAYLERGLDGLRPRKAKGKPGHIPAELADEIRSWVIAGPAGCGLDRANWTYQELADHLRKAKGVETSRSGVQRYCAKIDIRPYRPTYRYLRGDPAKQAKAKEDIADLKKKRRPARSCC